MPVKGSAECVPCVMCVCDCVFRLNLNKSGRTLRLSRQTTASLTHCLSSMNNCFMSGTYRCVTTLSLSLIVCVMDILCCLFYNNFLMLPVALAARVKLTSKLSDLDMFHCACEPVQLGVLSSDCAQVKWCSQVFSDPLSIVCELMSDMLSAMQPNLSRSFETYISSSGLSPVSALISLRQVDKLPCLSCVWEFYLSAN